MSAPPTTLARARLIREVLLDYGVPEVSIELQEGRPGGGWNGLDPVMVMSHHIASFPTVSNPTPGLSLVKQGRGGSSPLGGPLANGTAGVDLVYRILCLGWANHPGFGGPYTVRGPLGSFTIPRDNARPYAWGTEYEGGYTNEVWDKTYTNKRTGKKMTFREFMGRSNAGLAEAIWLPGVSSRDRYRLISPGMDLSTYTGEHKSWAPGRKPDRKDYTTESGQAEARRYAKKEEDDMFSDKDRETLEGLETSVTALRSSIAKMRTNVAERDIRIAARISRKVKISQETILEAIAEADAEEAPPTP